MISRWLDFMSILNKHGCLSSAGQKVDVVGLSLHGRVLQIIVGRGTSRVQP